MGIANRKMSDGQEVFGIFIRHPEGLLEAQDMALGLNYGGRPSPRVTPDDFDLLGPIGKGRYGVVELVRKRGANELYAMKTLQKTNVVASNEVQHTMTERLILASHSHPFLVKLRWAFQTPAHLCFVMDWANGGDLWTHLQSGPFPEDRARVYAAEVLLGLGHLHQLDIVYRDLKPENILLDAEGHVVLTDFGLSKVLQDSTTSTFCGTPEYIAPEVLELCSYGKAVDWWAFGTLLYEMLVGLPPFYSANVDTMYADIVARPLDIAPNFMSPDAASLIQQLLVKNPLHRLGSAEKVREHPFFDPIDWEALYRKEVTPPYRPPSKALDDLLQSRDSNNLWSPILPLVDGPDPQLFDGFTFVEEGLLTGP